MEMYGSVKDNNGYITRIDAGNVRKVEIIARGGEKGVTLHAPKGIAIHGDTLWVADIDVLRAFDRHSGASLGEIDFSAHRPTLLNDVAIGPDGRIRVTDTGIVMSEKGVVFDTTGDRVFIVGPGRAIQAIAAGAPYPKPNGITWDARGKRWLTVTFGQFESRLYELQDTSRTVLAEGKGKWDGVEALEDGRILFSSWSDSSIHVVERGRDRQLITGVATAADIGIDTRRKRIAIPLAGAGRVDIWSIPDAR
jgi:sugar lactone lactonase YvrE